MSVIGFSPIGPSPVRDFRTVDFTRDITPPPPGAPWVSLPIFPSPPPTTPMATIQQATWTCDTEPDSAGLDPDPSARLIQSPTFDATSTSQLIGDCVDGCSYFFTIEVTLSDNRILVKQASMACFSYHTHLASLQPGAIPFDYDEFISRFPEFGALPESQAQEYWDQACVMFRNDGSSPEQDEGQRRVILDVLTAHMAALFALPPIGRGGIGAMVGVTTSKSVNGVSVGNSGLLPGFTGTRAWLAMTQYGLKYLALTAGYRAFHYVQGPQRYPYPPNRVWPPYGYMPYWPWW
jgi:hypothetical protein